MAEPLRWSAASELTELLRRYYQGEAGLWPTIQAYVHVELRARGLPLAPRHVRFRRIGDSYDVIIEEADAFLRP
ncbi:MAG: hypothetical protein AB4911_16510 [Oscillochloridaceae bacterium umkhey_bin13]